MKKLILPILILSLAACVQKSNMNTSDAASKNQQPSQFAKKAAVQNEFVFKGQSEAVQKALADQGIAAKIEPVFQESTNHFKVTYKGEVSFKTLSQQLGNKVEWMEPNYYVDFNSSKNRFEWPNNKLFFKQWALNNVGQSPPHGIPGTEGADMDILKAWSLTKGSKDIIVAVIDEGVDYTHPALKDNMWVNFKEAPVNGGIAGVDDDQNGWVDDVYGYDFFTGDKKKLWYGKPGGPDPMDHGGHGTFCAGEIAAAPNTYVGTAGLNWNVRIMAVRFLGPDGGSMVDAARAVEYARINHADIMSNSWGGSGSSKLLQEAIASSARDGILFVAAAGNDGANLDVEKSYPASYKTDKDHKPLGNVLTVGASDNQDNPAYFSNFGHETVDVFAPGVAIVSTFPKALLEDNQEPYSVMSGTSMATPYVAGVSALMMAYDQSYRHHPDRIIETIQKTADVKPSLVGKAISNGRINAFHALLGGGQNPVVASKWINSGQTIAQRGFQSELVDIRHDVMIANASAIRMHFNFIQIEQPFDSVYLYDKDYRLITEIASNDTADFWSPIIPGDTVHVRFVNSLTRVIAMMPLDNMSSEYDCTNRGALSVEQKKDGKFSCTVDKTSEDAEDSKPYSSFNSEGFNVDEIDYVAANSGGDK